MSPQDEILLLQQALDTAAGEPTESACDFHALFHDVLQKANQRHHANGPALKIFLSRCFRERHAQIQQAAADFRQRTHAWRAQLAAIERTSVDSEQVSHEPVTTHVNSLLHPTTFKTPLSLPADYDNAGHDNPDDRWRKTAAVIPSMLAAHPKTIFNTRFVCEDARLPPGPQQSQDSPFLRHDVVSPPVWTEAEQRIFVQKYLVHSKAFHKIAAFLPFKTTGQCVRFYYEHKRRLQLKALMYNYRRGLPVDIEGAVQRRR